MNPQPQPKPRELTEEALNKVFSLNFTRKEALVVRTLILQKEYNLADAKLLLPVLEKIESTAMALTNQDYIDAEVAPTEKPPLNTN